MIAFADISYKHYWGQRGGVYNRIRHTGILTLKSQM